MNILIGNIISTLGAVFTILSSLGKDRKRIYLFQVLQCSTMVIASVFFHSYSGIAIYSLCTVRNVLAAYDKFSIPVCIAFIVISSTIGISCNNLGIIGIFPVIATAIYSIGSCVLKSNMTIKLNIMVNLLLWAVYDIIIMDYVTFTVDVSSVAVTLYSVINEKSNAAEK